MEDHLDLLLKDIRRSGNPAKDADDSVQVTACSSLAGDRAVEPDEEQLPLTKGRRRGMEKVWDKLEF